MKQFTALLTPVAPLPILRQWLFGKLTDHKRVIKK
ncbi:Uncharacterised protein [Vibrio cholerae]|nr:Uncharacterised protein [Vibrio cholerae]